MRIIHFVESGGGGVWGVLNNWISSTPQIQHTVFVRPRGIEFEKFENQPRNLELVVWTGSLWSGISKLREELRIRTFDALHFHSTWAGLFRMLSWVIPVIYSPHCFAFQDNQIDPFRRFFYYQTEKILSLRTKGYILVSKNEQKLSYNLNPSVVSIVVKHCVPPWQLNEAKRKVIGIGRITKQKNPQLFAQIAWSIQEKYPNVEFTWIGDGDEKLRICLENANVKVTGWLPKLELQKVALDAACLLHTALWEGMPLIFSEMQAGGLPILALKADYLEKITNIQTFKDISEAESIILDMLDSLKRNQIHVNDPIVEGQRLTKFYECLITR